MLGVENSCPMLGKDFVKIVFRIFLCRWLGLVVSGSGNHGVDFLRSDMPWDDSSPFFKHQHFFSELFPTIEQSNLSLTLIDQRGKFTDIFFGGKKRKRSIE